jgi:hypothetical protein
MAQRAAGLLVTLFEVETKAFHLSNVVAASVPFVACVIGLLVWALASGLAKTAGKIAFAAGLLVVLFECASRVIFF